MNGDLPEATVTLAVFALRMARERGIYLLREIARLQSKDYPFTTPRRVLGFLRANAELCRSRLDALATDPVFLHPDVPTEEKLKQVRVAASNLQFVHDALQLIDKVDSSRVPCEIVRCFENLARDLLGDQSIELMLQPGRAYNYGVLELSLAFRPEYYDQTQDIAGILLLNFPYAEPFVFLQHGLFLHELGHPLFRRRVRPELEHHLQDVLLRAFADLADSIDDEAENRLRNIGFRKDDLLGTPRFREEKNKILAEARRALFNWVEEAFCDFCGLSLAGPAYACSFKAFMLPYATPGEASTSHPDSALRLAMMDKHLTFLKAQSNAFHEVCDLFAEHASIDATVLGADTARDSVPQRIARRALSMNDYGFLTNQVFPVVDRLVPTPWAPSGIVAELRRAVSEMNCFIPPCPESDSSRRTGFSSAHLASFVLASAWIFKIHDYESWRNHYKWADEECEDVLNRLAIKAIEAGELKRVYLQAKV